MYKLLIENTQIRISIKKKNPIITDNILTFNFDNKSIHSII